MRLAVLNELRLAVGSFAPCEVVMPDCTRVLPLVALRAGSATSTAADPDVDCRRRTVVSPNRHPEAQTGAANAKVIDVPTRCDAVLLADNGPLCC